MQDDTDYSGWTIAQLSEAIVKLDTLTVQQRAAMSMAILNRGVAK